MENSEIIRTLSAINRTIENELTVCGRRNMQVVLGVLATNEDLIQKLAAGQTADSET